MRSHGAYYEVIRRHSIDTDEPDERDWRERAACLEEDPELFFPTGVSLGARLQTLEAKAVCERCPVKIECQAQSIEDNEQHGVFGGLDENERALLKAQKQRAKRNTIALKGRSYKGK